MLHGFRGITDRTDFWLTGARFVWHRKGKSGPWISNEIPPESNKLSGTAALRNGVLFVVRNELVSPPDPEDSQYQSDTMHFQADAKWQEVTSKAGPFVALEVISSPDSAYLRTHRGRVLKADRNAIEDLHAPGFCEALTATSEGKVLACIVRDGIFLYDREWEKLYEYPLPPDEGEHRVHVTERDGVVAFATGERSEIVNWTTNKRVWSGTTGVWISYEGKLKRVSIPGVGE